MEHVNQMKKAKKESRGSTRRRFLKRGLAGVAGLVVIERSYDYLSESKGRGKIVIIGGGAAGITMAARLTDLLRDPDITIIEPNEIHHYQPGYTMVAAGVFDAKDIVEPNAKLIPNGVKWIKDSVAELDPDNNRVMTRESGVVSYDFLVVVPGGKMNFDLIEGVSKETLGEGNAHCIYDYQGSRRCREALVKMAGAREGRMVFTNTYSKVKCGGAPKKICMIAEDFLRGKGVRKGMDFQFYSNSTNLMKPPVFGDRLAAIYKERDISTHFKHRLVSVDTAAKNAVFEKIPEPTLAPTPEGAGYERVGVDYDFLHFVPPMSTPDFIRDSPLPITEGKLRHGGWVDVDKETMIHKRYANIISLGDAAGLPTSKTGAAIRMQAPIAAANLVALMEGKDPEGKYNGYTACPIVTGYGKVLMCEFGYDKELMPTIPWIDPGVDRGMWWVLKKYGLKPMYYQGMLNGLV